MGTGCGGTEPHRDGPRFSEAAMSSLRPGGGAQGGPPCGGSAGGEAWKLAGAWPAQWCSRSLVSRGQTLYGMKAMVLF